MVSTVHIRPRSSGSALKRSAVGAFALALGAAFTLTSCTLSPTNSAISELHLFGLPSAVDLDGRPGADGITVRIFASTATEPRGVPIRAGTLEVLLFDGPLRPGQPLPSKPLHVWSLTPQQLLPLASESKLGTGYQLTLPWTGTPPVRASVSVIARHTASATARPVFSGPASISMR